MLWSLIETLLLVASLAVTFLFGFKFGVESERQRGREVR